MCTHRTCVALHLLGACLDQTNVALAQGNMNGAAGQMPAYYEGELFTVNMKEMPNSDPLIAKNPSLNEIYASNDLDEEQDFIPVIDAIQGEGFNPLWRQILIVFNEGFTPHQFVSEEEIDAAAAGPNPEITLVETDEVYRCSVVGRRNRRGSNEPPRPQRGGSSHAAVSGTCSRHTAELLLIRRSCHCEPVAAVR